MFISCQRLKFDTVLSQDRTKKAIEFFGANVIKRILCFALYLLGVNRSSIANQLEMPLGTMKSTPGS